LAAKKKKGLVVAVLNMKGGVGKTTISAHVFRLLYLHLQKSVTLVDFDPQFNLTQTIFSQDQYEKLKAAKKTILSVMEDSSAPSIFTINEKLGPPPALEDVSIRLRYNTTAPDISLSLVPGDFDLVKYSLIGNMNVLGPVKERFLQFIDKAREKKDLICIDCNPSSSFMTMCAIKAATHILVPVRPDRYSLLGLKMLDRFITEMPDIVPKPKMIILLNGLKSGAYDPTVENSLRSDPQFGPVTMASSLHTSKLLEASVGQTGFATDKKHNWRVTPRITAIVNELGKSLGLL
jgi:ATPases involved in chromosome partitioning